MKLILVHVGECIKLTVECGPRCTTRCSKTQYKKPYLFFCKKCCAKCLCVPPGTYDNKQ
uniref:Protein GAST1 n=1 Tax=Cajanus cajan TaxID=3821 RepID=A0A151R0V3_CAJCA|nr:Protein GAST1 [Cajanus cajan]